MSDIDHLQSIFVAQRAVCGSVPDLAQRCDTLSRLRRLLVDNQSTLAEAIDRDFAHRSRDETALLEVVPLVTGIDHALRNLRRWMRDRRRAVNLSLRPGRAFVRHEALGVVGIIAPWNYPLYLSLGPAIDALAAGNRVMIKVSELSPCFAACLAWLVGECFDETLIAVMTGDADLARAFSALPFDHLVFTGSGAVGREVMRAAAANLTPVTLELGGKSPAIVAGDYPLAAAARSIAFGKFVNAGQTCIAPDYALVPEGREQAFADAVLRAAQASYPPSSGGADYTAIISTQHYERLAAMIEEARGAGASVLSLDGPAEGRHLPPTVVLGAPDDCRLMQEEIFGPILPVRGYTSLDDAMDFVRARDKPLALYGFTHRRDARDQILSSASSGGVTLNGTLLHIAQHSLPFGGVGPSGMGAYHGEEGFRRFSHARAVHHVGAVNPLQLMGPPWGRLARYMTGILTR